MSDISGIIGPGTARRACLICGKPIRNVGGYWVHEQPHDPFAKPIHAPRPREPRGLCWICEQAVAVDDNGACVACGADRTDERPT